VMANLGQIRRECQEFVKKQKLFYHDKLRQQCELATREENKDNVDRAMAGDSKGACLKLLEHLYVNKDAFNEKIALDSIYIATRATCALGSLEGCLGYGRFLKENKPNEEEQKQAELMLQRAIETTNHECRKEDPVACNEWGKYQHRQGNLSECTKAFVTSCKHVDDAGCTSLALLVSLGGDDFNDKSIDLLERTCDKTNGPSCKVLGEYYHAKGDLAFRKDEELLAKAWKYAVRATDSGHCGKLTYWVAQTYYEGKRVPVDKEKAFIVSHQACKCPMERNDSACMLQGEMLADKTAPYFDLKKAERYFMWACGLGNDKACLNIWKMRNNKYYAE